MKIFKSLLLAVVFALTATGCASTAADTRVGIGIHLDLFPDLQPVPGYPVYYAPHVSANLFFYDGAYWLYDRDGWYVSDWYNGPWDYVEPDYVPWFVLRVPVRYYRAPPPYFWGWYHDAPPRWGHYWGPTWLHRHQGWDRWDRSYVPRRAPLPTYQRDYRGNRYPDYQRQRDLHKEKYPYRSQDPRYNKYRDDHRGNNRPGYDNRGNDRHDNNRYRNDNWNDNPQQGQRPYEGRDRPQAPPRDVKPRGPEGAQFERGREGVIQRTGMDRNDRDRNDQYLNDSNRNDRRYGERNGGQELRGFSQPQRPQPQEQRERPSREQMGREQMGREQLSREQPGRELSPRQDRGGWQQAPRQQQSAPPQQQQQQYQQPREY